MNEETDALVSQLRKEEAFLAMVVMNAANGQYDGRPMVAKHMGILERRIAALRERVANARQASKP